MIINCARCGDEIQEGDDYQHRGKTLCEDCYIAALQPPKSCDVAAVASAKKHRETTGQTGTEGLTLLQKEIYSYIKQKGKATGTELAGKFNLPAWELEKQLAILRHCELTRAHKEGDKTVFVTFDS